jgi:hypothetical protein
MTADHAIGSLQGGILQPIQQHTWDVTYVSDKPNNTIFTLHPFFSGKELAMFFPEEMKFLSGEVDRYHKIYTNPDKWNSSSPFEQTFQHKSALIVLYDIDPKAQHLHVDGFFPKNLDERIVDASGWIFCRAGSTFVGFFPLKQYEWIEEQVDWRWRSNELKNAVVVEAGSIAEDQSFEAFRAHLKKSIPGFTLVNGRPSVKYTTRHGDRLRFTFAGERQLNGKKIDFSSYRFFKGPFVNSGLKSGVVTLTAGGMKRVLDFNLVTITESDGRR